MLPTRPAPSCGLALAALLATGCREDSSFGPGFAGGAGEEDSGGAVGDTWCWMVMPLWRKLVLLVVELPEGNWYPYGRYGSGFDISFATGGLAYDGSSVVLSGPESSPVWMQLDMSADAMVRRGQTRMLSVAWDDAHYFTFCYGDSGPEDAICLYPDYGALTSDAYSSRLPGPFHAYRIEAEQGRVWDVDGDTHEIDIYDVSDGSLLRSMTLEGDEPDAQVNGLSVAGNILHVLYDQYPLRAPDIARYDVATGSLIDVTDAPQNPDTCYRPPTGLWCATKSPPLPAQP